MRKQTVLALALAALPASAWAQPMMGGGPGGGMPNLRAIVGKPLPDRGMPAGTVTVRVARKQPSNAAADLEITAVVRNAGGDARKRTAKTDATGRAMFEAMAPGDQFKAEVTVDGEKLATETFSIPAEGGIRTMLIAGLGKGGDGDGGGAGEAAGAGAGQGEGKGFAMGATAGSAVPDPSLPTGTLDVKPLDESGAPLPNLSVALGMVAKAGKLDVQRVKTDASGVARFTNLPTGEGHGYAAVIDWKGMRLGTVPFAMPEEGGARAEIRAFGRTSDVKVITIGDGGRIVVQMREDRLEILEMLPIENRSDQMFDPGVGAIEIPLPQGFVGASPGNRQGEHKLEVRQNHGVAVQGIFPPKQAIVGSNPRESGQEIEFGFVLPYHGDSKEFVQPAPNGIGAFTLITEQIPGLTVTGPGVGARQDRELSGRKYWIMPVAGVPPGGEIKFMLDGLPSTDSTGRTVAGGLSIGLVLAAFAFGRRPNTGKPGKRGGKRGDDEDERTRLIDKREALFSSLVMLERDARAEGSTAPPDRRKQLVGELEQVYRRLAALEEQRAA